MELYQYWEELIHRKSTGSAGKCITTDGVLTIGNNVGVGLFTTSNPFWIGGVDVNDQLKVAAQRFRHTRSEWWS